MSGSYVVLATELHQQTSAIWDHGQLRVELKRYRRGDVVNNLTDDDIERHLKSGAIAPKSSDEAKAAKESPAPEPEDTEYVPPADQPGPIVAEAAVVEEAGTVKRPRNTATKEAWVEYAVARGVDRKKAEGMTRDKLRDATK